MSSGHSHRSQGHRASYSTCSTSSHTLPCHPSWRDDEEHKPPKPSLHRYSNHSVFCGTPLAFSNHFNIQTRQYYATKPNESATIILGLTGVACIAKAAQYGVRAYNEWKLAQPEEAKIKNDSPESDPLNSSRSSSDGAQSQSTNDGDKDRRSNMFHDLFGFSVGTKYYEGGFEDRMTRSEASLILGVRATATSKRIKEAHRRILILNHPDTGGSTYLTSKINEAKELLLKGKE